MIPKAMRLISIILVSLLIFSPAYAETAQQETPWEQLGMQRIAFQTELYEIAVQRWPEHAELLQVHRDLQLAIITRRNLVFHYWKEHHPEKLNRSTTLKEMLQFSWTDADREEFVKNIPNYQSIDEQLELLRRLNNANPDWKLVQEKFVELETDPAYLQLIQKYEHQLQEIVQAHHAS